jgi:hypothetical protein
MGYDLHITRKDCWAEEEDERCISREEWKAYVENDPEITLDPDNPFEDYYIYLRTGENWPLWFRPELGNIYTKNPPDDVIKKIVAIASALKARVQGDDQEFYDSDGNMIREEQNYAPTNDTKSSDSYERYIWYFGAIVVIISMIWHTFIPTK